MNIDLKPAPPAGFPLFALGFRPFFFSAGLSALLLLPLWVWWYSHPPGQTAYMPPLFWHSHEMLLGYAVAVISGFLLTAVGNWTGTTVIQGSKLAALVGLWWAGRLALLLPLPPQLTAVIDLSFLLVLMAVIAKPILQKKQFQQAPILALLASLWLANGLVHAQLLGWSTATVWLGHRLALYSIVLLIILMSGRVLPFFTERGLVGYKPKQWPWLDKATLPVSALTLLSLLLWPQAAWPSYLALGAVGINAIRLWGWYTHAVWQVPLLWVLYSGYGWLLVGLLLAGLTPFYPPLKILMVHAFTVGGIGVMTLGMMARVTLGHTGRDMQANRLTSLAFVIINLAAAVRVLAVGLWPSQYAHWINGAAGLWVLAFALFLWVYGPMLWQARVDGRAG